MKKHQVINLIPESQKVPTSASMDSFIILGIVAVLLLCLGNFFFTFRSLNHLNIEVALVMQKQAEADQQINEVTSRLTSNAVLDEQQKLIRQVIGAKPNWADAFKELSLVIPRETWLSQLKMKNTTGKLAVSIKGETSSQRNMADFLSSLERSEFFNNMLMISSKLTEKTNPPLYSFEFADPVMMSSESQNQAAAQ